MNTLRRTDEEARRAYWARMMDEGYDFMRKVPDVPVAECGEGVASLPRAVAAAGVDVTFCTRPHVTGGPRLHYLREGLVDGFLAVALAMNRVGWVLRVEDAYRSADMQRGLALHGGVLGRILNRVIRELGDKRPDPDFLYRRVAALIAVSPRVATHMSGSAVDISVTQRGDGSEIDRGGPYLEMSELTPMDSPFVPDEAKRNRQRITGIFLQSGFVAYPPEFWHYSRDDAFDALLRGGRRPARYGPVDVDPETGRVNPIANADEPLVTVDDIRQAMRTPLDT